MFTKTIKMLWISLFFIFFNYSAMAQTPFSNLTAPKTVTKIFKKMIKNDCRNTFNEQIEVKAYSASFVQFYEITMNNKLKFTINMSQKDSFKSIQDSQINLGKKGFNNKTVNTNIYFIINEHQIIVSALDNNEIKKCTYKVMR